MRKHKGFTLIELMIVIAFFGILASIILGAYKNVDENASDCNRHDVRITAIEHCRNDERCAMTAKDYEDYETMKAWRDQCRREGSTKTF
jgi:prepilin-type N-terminal cleavage/methylation domain-containing protein